METCRLDRWLMINKDVPKEWKELLSKEVILFIERKIASGNQRSAFNTLIGFQELTHTLIDWNDLDLIQKLLSDYL